CYGMTGDGRYVIASESCALDAVGAHFIRDIRPGEVMVFSREGVTSLTDAVGSKRNQICIFEYIYFARPDSVIDGVSVHEARQKAGEILAREHGVEADVVVGVPDSGLDAALGYSKYSGIPYGIGLIKNKYIGRTFISPTQNERNSQVRIKLSPIASTVKGKRVVLIDDSIVRGTTCERIVRLIREAGAKEIHMRISSPPFTNPCYYGTDIDSKDKLIACHHSVEEIAKIIGADSLGYLPVDSLSELVGHNDYCNACFTGDYATRVPENISKNRFEKRLSER
ncbi:MAG: amidophosphoribosyltransferase, partial [Eubacterium sp.]|nr:amidophosphoribosyltransferase [Eubacterium sp.]